MIKRPTALLTALLLLLALPYPGLAAGGEWEVKVSGRLPEGNYRACSVSTGTEVLIFGGRNGTDISSSVLRYDLLSRSISRAPFYLPQPRMSCCAVFDGKVAFVFGGSDGGLELDSILAIDPSAGAVRTSGTDLPSPRIGLTAALWGGQIYIFGGHSNGTMITEILRFVPGTESLTGMGARLATGRAGTGIISTEKGIYLFGGKTDGGSSDEVLLYEPDKDRLTVLPDRLPYQVYHAPAVWTGERAFIVGGSALFPGWNVSKATDAIIEFDPASGVSRICSARLPSPRERTVAAFHGGTIFVFGGQEGVRELDEILTIGPAKGEGKSLGGPVMWAAVPVVLLCLTFALVLARTGRR